MKSILLAAAAFIAAPVIAQEQPAPAEQSAPAAPAADPAMQAPPAATGADPVGGYQPSSPPMHGTPEPGSTVRFQPAADPATAYPAPAPLAKYPVCKKGQYDKCIQRGGK